MMVVDRCLGGLLRRDRGELPRARSRDLIHLTPWNVVKREPIPARLLAFLRREQEVDAGSSDAAPVARPVARRKSADVPSGMDDPDHDRALMRLVCERDEAALTALYDRYCASVNGLALSILRNPALAEEATHDVFLRLWQQPTAYDASRGSFAGWLLRVARNRSIDLLRRRREDPVGAMDADVTAWIADPAPGPEEEAIDRMRRQAVRQALGELTPDHRQLLELAYFTGLSQSQIAEHLGRPLGTVKSQIRAAMGRLAERLVASGETTDGESFRDRGGRA